VGGRVRITQGNTLHFASSPHILLLFLMRACVAGGHAVEAGSLKDEHHSTAAVTEPAGQACQRVQCCVLFCALLGLCVM
jgi:hypothetical protein